MLRCCLAVLCLSTAALAQVKQAPEAKKEAPVRKSVIIFNDGTEIPGTRDAPDIAVIEVADPPRFSNLIKVRDNFNDKLAESVFEL